MAKHARERAVKEKRALKLEKKATRGSRAGDTSSRTGGTGPEYVAAGGRARRPETPFRPTTPSRPPRIHRRKTNTSSREPDSRAAQLRRRSSGSRRCLPSCARTPRRRARRRRFARSGSRSRSQCARSARCSSTSAGSRRSRPGATSRRRRTPTATRTADPGAAAAAAASGGSRRLERSGATSHGRCWCSSPQWISRIRSAASRLTPWRINKPRTSARRPVS